MKTDRLEWNVWDELLGVAFQTLEPQIKSKAIITIFKKNLLGRTEDDFWKYGNGWVERKKDWVKEASQEFSGLNADAVAAITEEAICLAAALDMTSAEQPGILTNAVATYLENHVEDYSTFGLQCAKQNVLRQCTSVATDIAKGTLRTRRSLSSDQVVKILQVTISACEYYAKNPFEAENFPISMVFQQLIKQRKETLAGTKLLLKELYVKVVDLPWVYAAERAAREKLRGKCEELLLLATD